MNAGILSSYTVDTNTATHGDPKLHSAARRAKTHDSTLVLGQNSSELPSPQISGHSVPTWVWSLLRIFDVKSQRVWGP